MGIQVIPYADEHVAAVHAFNRRMTDGGTPWGWYTQAEDEWLPRREGIEVWREHFLAVEEGEAVRGAYALKPQPWLIRGERVCVTDWQGPVSEGVIERRYNTVGLRMIRDMVKRRPLLYSWGHGEDEARMLQMLRTMGWQTLETPFCLRVLRPHRFLRHNGYLRRSARNRLALDALAFSGAGWLGLKAWDVASAFRKHRPRGVEASVVERFGEWADALWERGRGDYQAIGLRDAATLNALMPEAGWPAATRLRVRRDGEDIGWAAVLDTAHRGSPRFGDLRLGSVIDAFAPVDDAADVIASATHFLADRGVDAIVSNQAHPKWQAAFEGSGFLLLPARRLMAMSPGLSEALAPIDETRQGLHLTNMDGHGPRGL